MLYEGDIIDNDWKCFDIEPGENVFPKYIIQQQDTLSNYPQKYKIAITNPPYLSKNSATRRGLTYPNTDYDDIYKLCLKVMLENTPYVAAIIPETFITAGIFHDRLHSIVSLTCRMFDDTDCPVCLAMFVPKEEAMESFDIYRMNDFLGTYKELKEGDVPDTLGIPWVFNDPNGKIGIKCVDNTRLASIKFIDGNVIDSKKIKVTSRSATRVGGLPEGINIQKFIDDCNGILDEYREQTKDVFMASFKGLRVDGLYRRRLDFSTARRIMNQALQKQIRGNR